MSAPTLEVIDTPTAPVDELTIESRLDYIEATLTELVQSITDLVMLAGALKASAEDAMGMMSGGPLAALGTLFRGGR